MLHTDEIIQHLEISMEGVRFEKKIHNDLYIYLNENFLGQHSLVIKVHTDKII